MKRFIQCSVFVLLSLLVSSVSFGEVVQLSPTYFPSATSGRPVSNGYVYVGFPDTDPTVTGNQKQLSVLQEDGSTVQVSQPVRTNAGGLPTYNGSVVTLLVDGAYSITVLDRYQSQAYYVPSSASTLSKLSDYGSCDIAAAVTAIGSTLTTLDVDCDATLPDGASVTTPQTLYLHIKPTGKFSGTAGGSTETLAVYSPENIIASDKQGIFGSNLTVTFTQPGRVSARWPLAADPDGSTSNTTAIQMIIDALPAAGGEVKFPGYNSSYVATLTAPANVALMGEQYYSSIIKPDTDASPVVTVGGARVRIVDIDFDGNGVGTSDYAIRSDRAIDGAAGGTLIERCYIDGFTYGLYFANNYYNTARQLRINDVQYGIFGRNSFNANSLSDIKTTNFDYGTYLIYDEDVDTFTSFANTFKMLVFESPNNYALAETVDGKPAVGVYIYNTYGNTFNECYFEGFASNNAWPVIEAGGPVTGVHGGGDNTAYLTDESGRDFTQLGVEVGMTVENITDGSTGSITAIGDDAAKNDKISVTLAGGTDNDFDNNDYFLIDLDTEFTGGSKLRNAYNYPQFTTQADANRFVAGYNQIVSEVGGMWVSQRDGDLRFNKTTSYGYSANERYTVDLSGNISAWAGFCIGKARISFTFIEGGAGTGNCTIRPVGGGTNQQDKYYQFNTSGYVSDDIIVDLDDNNKFQFMANRAGTLSIRIHEILVSN